MPLTITPIPAFSDNYIWCLDNGQLAAVVDPGDAWPVLEHLKLSGLQLACILITHHHPDHVGGVKTLKRETGCRVVGPDNPAIAGIDHCVAEGDAFECLGRNVEVLDVPGHTLDHIAYLLDREPLALFCGDTLFAGGCGRLFEGTPAMMRGSLAKVARLPGDTEVYCAHEYTLSNLAFAEAAEPGNTALARRIEDCRGRREAGEPTLPATIATERETNPFLRWDSATVVDTLRAAGRLTSTEPDAVFAALRSWKDNF